MTTVGPGQSPLLLAEVARELESRGIAYVVIGAMVADAHGNRADLLAGLRGTEPGTFHRALEVPFEGVTLRVAGLEDFLAMKAWKNA